MSPITFPQELINRFIDELAPRESYKDWHLSQDLQSCSLVSTSFHFHSRKYLFLFINLVIYLDEPESQPLKNLRQILEENPTIQREIWELQIECRDNRNPVHSWVASPSICDIHLPHILRMLRDVRGLWIHSSLHSQQGLKWNVFDNATRLAFWDLQEISRGIKMLAFRFVGAIPACFIYTFKNLKILHLTGPNVVANTQEDPPVLLLDELRLEGTRWVFPAILQGPTIASRIRKLHLDMMFYNLGDIKMSWTLLQNASKTLESLYINPGFGNDQPHEMNIDNLPSLRTIQISEEGRNSRTLNELFSISRFLTPVKHSTKLQSIDINLDCSFSNDTVHIVGEELFLPENGWSQLDDACTSSKSPAMRQLKVEVGLWYPHQFPEDQAIRFKQLLEQHSASDLLPLTSASNSIAVELGITVGFRTPHLVWRS